MILATVMMRYYFLLVLFYMGLCAAYADPLQTDHITAYGASLTIYDDRGTRYLQIDRNGEKATLPVIPRAPCYFLRYSDDETMQQFSYPKQGIKAILTISGTSVTPEQRKIWSVSEDKLCGTEGHGLIVDNKGKFRLSQSSLGGGLFCKLGGRDEKDYWTFAHEKSTKK